MSSTTTNYGLTKPGIDDEADITVLSDDLDLIDTAIKAASESGGDIVVGDEGVAVDPNPETFDGHTSGEFLLRAGGTMSGKLTAQNNSDYAVGQVRNIYFATTKPADSVGGNGDVCLIYV